MLDYEYFIAVTKWVRDGEIKINNFEEDLMKIQSRKKTGKIRMYLVFY